MLTPNEANALVDEFMRTNDFRQPLDGDKMKLNLHRCLAKYVGVLQNNVADDAEGGAVDPTEGGAVDPTEGGGESSSGGSSETPDTAEGSSATSGDAGGGESSTGTEHEPSPGNVGPWPHNDPPTDPTSPGDSTPPGPRR